MIPVGCHLLKQKPAGALDVVVDEGEVRFVVVNVGVAEIGKPSSSSIERCCVRGRRRSLCVAWMFTAKHV